MTKHLRQKIGFLLTEIEQAIAQDSTPKLNAANYPGYWLYIAGEHLPAKNYQHLLLKLGLDERDVMHYKFNFTLELYVLLEQEGQQP